ncbi:unnamed protein product [Tuber melanosporum]|uniref:(Perigord truffle) hypothetical protein n=1 Tax=Tuber melanosporum (strain Mel28) TaxID=656061 RepID=D5G6P9_TUBMM|nr:uncharacterized protein GSTUM_00002159001 [Tuber melanosporum]CAZ80192.1 unnamed protein product [Tuber melanosporum]
MEYRRLSRCGVDGCKQTLFYLDDGQWFCKNGHLREGELEVAADDEGFGTQGSRAAEATQEREKKGKVLRGRKGFELFLQCYQLILRKQVHWLVSEKRFPRELEIVVRDLWALQLQKVSTTVPTTADDPTKSRDRYDGGDEYDDGDDGRNLDGSGDVGSSSAGYSSQSSYLYTSDDSQSTAQSRNSQGTQRRRRKRRVPRAADRPKLVGSVGICYLGLIVLGVAVSLGDIHRWVEEQGIVYLRAINEIPSEMKQRLDAEYYVALDPRVCCLLPLSLTGVRPTLGLLHSTVQGLVIMYQVTFGMAFPPLNITLLVFGFMKALGLPLEIYYGFKRLANLISLPFMWNGLRYRGRVTNWPEARLMALLIISTKLLYGLDGVKRTPKSAVEPAATGLKWRAWDGYLRTSNAEHRGLLSGNVTPGSEGGERGRGVGGKDLEVDVEEKDVFDMTGEELDRYMDWFEKNWADDSNTPLTKQIIDLFPTGRAAAERAGVHQAYDGPRSGAPADKPAQHDLTDERLRELNSQFEIYPAQQQPEEEEGEEDEEQQQQGEGDNYSSPQPQPQRGELVTRPGGQYLWHSIPTELPVEQQTLLQAGADLLAITRDDLARIIKVLETQFRDLVKNQRRKEMRERRRMDVD